jgi:phosphatidate cytidylyltransferase
MALDKKVFLTRLGSAIVFSIIMLSCLLWNEWSFIALFLFVAIVALKEFASIVEKILGTQFSRNEKMNFYFIGIATFLTIVTLPINTGENAVSSLLKPCLFYFLGISLGAVMLFFIFKKNKESIYLLTGIGYISMSLGLLVQLRFMNMLLPLSLIVLIWTNDTMAYLVGSFIGKTKMATSISPKKTIEGTLGGILFCMLFAALWGYFSNTFSISLWITFGLIASAIGTLGDLVESKLKRLADVKDSGMIMPGHGGALDRFDSLLLAAPFAYLVSLFFL